MKKILFLALIVAAFIGCSKSSDDPKSDDPKENGIPASYYKLSEDGLTLLKWEDTNTTSLDMQADSKLQKVNTIAANAFRDSKVENITLPNNLKEIGDYAFINSRLHTITFNTSSSVTFGQAVFEDTQLVSVKLPNTKEIPASSFSGCVNLKEVQFGKTEKIGERAFRGCVALTQINLDNTTLTEIGERAFAGCENVEKVILPSTIKKIDKVAFFACFRLSTLIVKAIEVPTLVDPNALNNSSQIRRNILVPSSSVQKYKGAPNWNFYSDEISAILEI